jgi:hypothetical protein
MFNPRFPPVPTTTEPGRVFAGIVAVIVTLIARILPADPGRAALTVPLRRYLTRTASRFDRLLARLAAGIQPRARAPRPDRKQDRPNPRLRLPAGKAWLRAALDWPVGSLGSQIQFLLDRPEHAPLIAASPQAHRLLRPLCRMLGLAPACIPPLPRRPRKPRPKPEPKPKRLSYKQREALLWYPNIEGRPMKLLPSRAVLAREPPAYLPAALLPVPKKPA